MARIRRSAFEPDPGLSGAREPIGHADVTLVANPTVAKVPSAATIDRRRSPAMLDVWTGLVRVAETASTFVVGMGLTIYLKDTFDLGDFGTYARAVVIGTCAFGIAAELFGSYDIDVRFSLRLGWGRVFSAWAMASITMLTFAFFVKVSGDFSRAWAIVWFFAQMAVLGTIRASGTLWMRHLKRQGLFNQRVAIFGAGAQGHQLARYIIDNKNLTIDLVGFFDERPVSRLSEGASTLPLAGDFDQLIERIRSGDIDQVMVALPLSAAGRLREIVARLAVMPVLIRLAPDLATFAFAHRPIVMLGELPVMTLFERPISGFSHFIKKLEDIVFGSAILVVTIPVLVVTALAILIEDGRPIFFCQEREGYNHRRFPIWKFRSMKVPQSQLDQIVQARRGDPRVTKVGKFIRATSIDELPQLYNVFRGEMSIVGPRPHAPSTRVGSQLFRDAVADYAARHKVKPGITGWAQVNGWRGETDTEEKLIRRLEYDMFYIENWSVGFDVYIIFRTVMTLFSRSAY